MNSRRLCHRPGRSYRLGDKYGQAFSLHQHFQFGDGMAFRVHRAYGQRLMCRGWRCPVHFERCRGRTDLPGHSLQVRRDSRISRADRRDRDSRQDSVRQRSPEDAQRQDHEAHPPEDRHGRRLRPRGYQHARRSRCARFPAHGSLERLFFLGRPPRPPKISR